VGLNIRALGFFFLTCPYKKGEGRFELVISAS